MKKVLLVYRAINQGVDITSSGYYKKKKKHWLTYLGISAYSSLGILIKTIIENFFILLIGLFISSAIFTSLQGMPGVFKLSIWLFFPCMFTISSSLMYIKDFVLGSKENSLLLAMPFSARHIMWGRIIFMIGKNMLQLFLMYLGGFCLLVYRGELALSSFVTYWALVGGLLVILNLIIILTIFMFLFVTLLHKLGRMKLLENIINVITLVFSVVLGIGMIFIINAKDFSVPAESMARMVDRVNIIYPYYLFNLSINSTNVALGINYFWLASLIVATVLLMLLFSFLADLLAMPFIQSQQIVDDSTSLSKKKGYLSEIKKQKIIGNLNKNKSPFKALYSTNKPQFKGSSTFAFNLWFTPHMGTIFMFIGLAIGIYNASSSASEFSFNSLLSNLGIDWVAYLSFSEIYSKLVLMLIMIEQMTSAYIIAGLIFTLLMWFYQTSASSYIFSKDGLNLVYFKTLPISNFQLYFSRIKFSFFHLLYVLILPILILGILIILQAWKLVFFLSVILIAFIVFELTLIPLLDWKYKLLNWDNEQQIFKRKMGIIFPLLFAVLFVPPVAISLIFMNQISQVNSVVYMWVLSSYYLTITGVMIYFAYRKIPKMFAEVLV